jgi:hypothetical protein
MAHSNAIHLSSPSFFSFKPLIAIKDYIVLLASALAEARQLEQETRKTCGNW